VNGDQGVFEFTTHCLYYLFRFRSPGDVFLFFVKYILCTFTSGRFIVPVIWYLWGVGGIIAYLMPAFGTDYLLFFLDLFHKT